MDWCLWFPTPALLLVVAVDMRDSPDILQVKAHPRKFSLLPTSYVLSCNIAPMPLSIQEFYVQRYRKDENPEEVSQRKQPGLTWLTQVGMLVLLSQPQAPGMVGKGKEVLRLGRSCCGPA